MLVPGHALERYGKRRTQRIPRAVCVLKRRLLPSMKLRSFPVHTGTYPSSVKHKSRVRKWDQKNKYREALTAHAGKVLKLVTEPDKRHKVTRSSFPKTDCFAGKMYFFLGIISLVYTIHAKEELQEHEKDRDVKSKN